MVLGWYSALSNHLGPIGSWDPTCPSYPTFRNIPEGFGSLIIVPSKTWDGVFNDHGNTSQAKRTIELKFMEFSSIFQLAIRSWDHADHAKSDDEMDCQESSMIIRTYPDPSACASGAPRRRAQHLLNRHGLGRDHVTKKAIRCDQAQLSQRAADDSEIHEVCSILLVKPT